MVQVAVAEDQRLGGELIQFASFDEWRDAHSKPNLLTGTDAGTIVGVSPYSSPYELWCVKTGRLEREFGDSPAAKWGRRLEAVIREGFVEDKGLNVVTDPPNSMRVDPRFKWRAGSFDGHVYEPGVGWGIWEAKTAGAHMSHLWDNKVPLQYLMQVTHYMLISGYSFTWFAALIGGNKEKYIRIEADQKLLEVLDEAERTFLAMIQKEQPPPMDGHTATSRALGNYYSEYTDVVVELGQESLEWDKVRSEAIQAVEEALEKRTYAENKIRRAIGDASYAMLPDGTRYSWKGNPRRLNRLKTKAKVEGGTSDE